MFHLNFNSLCCSAIASTFLQYYVSLPRSLIISFSKPATRPSTRIQRRAQPTVPRRQSSRHRTTSAATAQRQATCVGSSTTTAPRLATESPEGAATFSTSLNDATFERIVSAVSQAVLSSVNRNLHPQPPSLAAAASPATTDLVEMPVVQSGSALSHPATASTPVATALSNVMGEGNVLQVSQSSQPALPHFHSVDVPIDANVSPKIKAKIWSHEFIDLGILLSSGTRDTRYHLSVSSPQGSSLPTLSLEPSHKPKNIPNIDSWTSAF